MAIKKDKIFTMLTGFDIIKSAVKQVTKKQSPDIDIIIYNSINKAIAKRKGDKI